MMAWWGKKEIIKEFIPSEDLKDLKRRLDQLECRDIKFTEFESLLAYFKRQLDVAEGNIYELGQTKIDREYELSEELRKASDEYKDKLRIINNMVNIIVNNIIVTAKKFST